MKLNHSMEPLILQQDFKYCVGLSGGVDSVVLLHALKKAFIEQDVSLTHLTAVHINHGISEFASNWQQFCEQYCAALDIKLKVFKEIRRIFFSLSSHNFGV